jgi:DNA-binding CsgD family transcriptional regulator
MTSPLPVPITALTDALNERELEILRLLAGGHTVKSIAVQLGRSEASINERLREARRKTGVGSSRELARLIDTKKSGTEKAICRRLRHPPRLRPCPATRGRSNGRKEGLPWP